MALWVLITVALGHVMWKKQKNMGFHPNMALVVKDISKSHIRNAGE